MTAARATYLYRAYNAGGRLLYVGISFSPEKRMDQHQADRWYRDIEAVTIEKYPDRRSAKSAETKAIHTESPLWNIDLAPDRFLIWDLQWREFLATEAECATPKRPLQGAAKLAHERRMEREFEEDLKHCFYVRRCVRMAMADAARATRT